MKKGILLIITVLAVQCVIGQKYITKTGHISFFSETAMENIEAHNKQVNCALDVSNGNMAFKVLNKSFEFERALMQEHFNENYIESHKFPTSLFSGKILNMDKIDLSKNGSYDVEVKGSLTIHGVKNEITKKGKITVEGDKIKIESKFPVIPEDYDIAIPGAVRDKIEKEIDVSISAELKKLK